MDDEEYGEIFFGELTLSMMFRLILVAFLIGAVVGQALDFAYPLFNALHYTPPTWKNGSIEVVWWMPILYGFAGVILWSGYVLLLRRTHEKPRGGFNPKWKFMLTGIGCFVLQFYGGPFLCGLGMDHIWLFVIIVSTGVLVWWVFDRTRAGLFMLFLAAILGPFAENIMINVLHLYYYTRPDIFGVPLWFIGAYMCGAAPNAMVGRKYLIYLQRQKLKSKDLVKEKKF